MQTQSIQNSPIGPSTQPARNEANAQDDLQFKNALARQIEVA